MAKAREGENEVREAYDAFRKEEAKALEKLHEKRIAIVKRAFAACGWRLSATARLLGLPVPTLLVKIRKWGLETLRDEKRPDRGALFGRPRKTKKAA